MTKTCGKCGKEKKISEFGKDNRAKDGLRYVCKECRKNDWKKYYKENKEKVLKKNKKYFEENPNKRHEIDKKFRKSEKRKNYLKKWRYNRYHNDPEWRLRDVISSHLYRGLKKSDNVCFNFLGCSVGEYKIYLEEMFKDGMSWDNYGEWHIDHIRPISSFDLSNDKEILECFNYKNTQPLWADENLKKSNKWEGED